VLSEVLIILSLVLVNGLFSGAEIALVSIRKTRIEQLLESGRRGAKAVAELRADPERFLATVQVGITVVGAAAAAYGGDALADRLTPLVEPLLGPHAHRAVFAAIVGGISFLSLVLGELVPKSLALRAGEPYALLVARPLLGLATLARPLVWLLTQSSNAVLTLFGDKTSFTEARVSPEELKAMLEDASEAGTLHPRVGEIASRAVELSELRASDVMVPRNRILAVEKDASIESLTRLIASGVHSRLPVYEGTIDHVVGYLSVRDAFTRRSDQDSAGALMRPIIFVPESMAAVDVLQTLQTRGTRIAIVVDEHGGTAGLVTREDLAEELFGQFTEGSASAEPAQVEVQGDGTIVIAGAALVREINRELELRLPEDEDWTTIAGMVVGLAGRIPAKGERVAVPGGPLVEIVDASPRRVRVVKLLGPAEPREEPVPSVAEG
jgi:putative hemolysin